MLRNDLDSSLDALRGAVGAFLAAVDRAASTWTVPRAPGKWSPSQVAEHVARIMEESANVVSGTPSHFPTLPVLVRPILGALVFKRILRRGAFLKMKAIDAFDPAVGAATPSEAHARLEGALSRFDLACRARASSGQAVRSTIFGVVSVAEFATFQELHVRHHLEQVPGAAYRPSAHG